MSVAILSIGLVLILNSFIRSTRAMELSKDYFKAGLCFGEKMYELSNSEIKEGSGEGSFNDFNSAFSWRTDVLNIEDSLNEVDLEVSWNERDAKREISLVTYLRL